MKEKWTLIRQLLLLFILILSIGTVNADNVYALQIDKGDAYQINNYVIQLTATTSGAAIDPTIEFLELKSDGSNVNLKDYVRRRISSDATEFYYTFEKGSEEISLNVINATTTHVIANIITTGFAIEYQAAVDGGVSNAKFTGEPNIVLTKEVDKTSVEIGDIIRVTIKAKNTGEGKARQINVDRGLTSGFIFKEDLPVTLQTELDPNEEYTMLIYNIEATTGGTFTLKPATATYYSTVSDDKYSASSNTPTITVAEEAVETSALELKISQDKTKLKREETITFKVYVRNLKDVPATAVKIEPIIPKNLTYVSGSDEINIINEKPVIQESSFGARYENEYEFVFEANEIGSESLTVKLTYNNGLEDISNETTSGTFYVEKGKYDYLAEFPIYVYITPIIFIIAIAGWIYWRSSQFRM